MANFVVLGFDEPQEAETVCVKLQKLHHEGLLDLADVVVAVKDETGKAKLHHANNILPEEQMLREGQVFPGLFPSLASLIFANATSGGASLGLADIGITDRFIKELATILIPSRSALFVLTRTPTPDRERLLEELKGLGGKVIMTWLSYEDQARLQSALSAKKVADP